jgi:hypothetical protein
MGHSPVAVQRRTVWARDPAAVVAAHEAGF